MFFIKEVPPGNVCLPLLWAFCPSLSVVPFLSQKLRPPWQGVWEAATIKPRGMRSFEWSGPLFHANPFGHRVPACHEGVVHP